MLYEDRRRYLYLECGNKGEIIVAVILVASYFQTMGAAENVFYTWEVTSVGGANGKDHNCGNYPREKFVEVSRRTLGHC